ncbi:MAG: glycosyltransferase family 4 protein [Actinomycetota bacterium]|nr:glycosyltransferase family 4 protein [Actinomycetota bacterium]
MRSLRPEWDIHVSYIDTVTRTSRYLTGAATVRHAARTFRPDVTHVHFGLAQILARGVTGPRVVTFHGSDLAIPWKRRISLAFLSDDDVPVVVSPAMKRALPSTVESRARVVPCGVDTTRFQPRSQADARAELGWDTHATYIGFPAAPSRPEKRYPLFCETIEHLRDLIGDVRIIEFDGVDPTLMPVMLAGLDLLLVTSAREGSPVVVREALCVGTRVVSTDVGDVADYLPPLSGCRVVACEEPQTIALECTRALSDPAPDAIPLCAALSTAKEADAIARIYEELVS